MPKIMIQNNCGGIVTVQLPQPRQAMGRKKADALPASAMAAHPEDRTVNLGKAVDLVPGASIIDLADWLEARKNPLVAKMLKERVPRSHAPEQEPRLIGRCKLVEMQQVADEAPLAGMTTPAALKVVRETLDSVALAAWLEQETRDELRKAIAEQLAELDAPYIGKGHTSGAPEGQDVGGGASTDDPEQS